MEIEDQGVKIVDKILNCSRSGKVSVQISPFLFRILHLMLKESGLYTGIEEFLHLYLRYMVTTHAEGVAESMRNNINIHGDKRRTCMDFDPWGKKPGIVIHFILWTILEGRLLTNILIIQLGTSSSSLTHQNQM